jgi:hypothetical protein
MKITGDVRPGHEFELTAKPTSKSKATFIVALPGELRVTRRLSDILDLPDNTPVIAHWHGQHRTDGFATTVGELKQKAA